MRYTTKRHTHLDDLYELVDTAVSGEYWLSEQQLCQNAAGWPDVDVCCVVCGTENELGGAIIPRADIRHVGFTADQLLCTVGNGTEHVTLDDNKKKKTTQLNDKCPDWKGRPAENQSHSSPAKVAQLKDGSFGIDKQVLGLDVSVTHSLGMDVRQTAKQLVHVHLKRPQHKKIYLSDSLIRQYIWNNKQPRLKFFNIATHHR